MTEELPICDVCGQESDDVYDCVECGRVFCPDCGSAERLLCEGCINYPNNQPRRELP